MKNVLQSSPCILWGICVVDSIARIMWNALWKPGVYPLSC